ncbi:MAG: hypothetical protein KJ690_18000 [Alphaproteobacteria bacterium]|nr:hypothetical protein [Alphaproteobacteria bacterium]
MIAFMKRYLGKYWTDTILAFAIVIAILTAFALVLEVVGRFGGNVDLATFALVGIFLVGGIIYFIWRAREPLIAAAVFLWPIPVVGAVIGGIVGGAFGALIGAVGGYAISAVGMILYFSR